MRLYAGSDGEFYTELDVGYRFETGEWQPCMWDTVEGWELVQTPTKQLLWLIPIQKSDLPDGITVLMENGDATIVDTRDP